MDDQPGIEVFLNVYDVVPPDPQGTINSAQTAPITRLNNLTRNLFGGVGGIFHGAIVIGEFEYSFGYCETGPGVYNVKARQNPMYTFRETINLGKSSLDRAQIQAIIKRLRMEWPGSSYDLLSRNCCHFCDVFAAELGVKPVPAWLNRFALGAAAALQATNDASNAVRGIRDEVARVSVESLSWARSTLQRTMQQLQAAQAARQQQQQLSRGWDSQEEQQRQLPQSPAQQRAWEAPLAPEQQREQQQQQEQQREQLTSAWVAQASSMFQAARRGWQVALNGRAPDGPEAAQQAEEAAGAAAAAAAGPQAGLAGAGGSSSSVSSSVSSHRAALPTTALRWVAPRGGAAGEGGGGGGAEGEGEYEGTGEALGLRPQ